jgi:serine/threonine protein kinase
MGSSSSSLAFETLLAPRAKRAAPLRSNGSYRSGFDVYLGQGLSVYEACSGQTSPIPGGTALQFLHSQGICHGDFRSSNLLVRVKDISKVTKDEMRKVLGRPKLETIGTFSCGQLGPDAPSFLVAAASLSKLELSNDIGVIDFGASFEEGSLPRYASIPGEYAAPEVLFGHKFGRSINIWSFACTILEVRTQEKVTREVARGARQHARDPIRADSTPSPSVICKVGGQLV